MCLVSLDQKNLQGMQTDCHYYPCRILKENGLTNIDELMDSQFGKLGIPERERFREEARTYVNGHAKTAERRTSQKEWK